MEERKHRRSRQLGSASLHLVRRKPWAPFPRVSLVLVAAAGGTADLDDVLLLWLGGGFVLRLHVGTGTHDLGETVAVETVEFVLESCGTKGGEAEGQSRRSRMSREKHEEESAPFAQAQKSRKRRRTQASPRGNQAPTEEAE